MSRLGELLVREQLVSNEQLHKALDASRKSGERLGVTLVRSGALSEEDLSRFLSRQYGVPAVNLAEFEIEADVIALIPREVARKHRVIPMSRAGNALIVATSDPSNVVALDDLKFLTNYNIDVVVASEAAITEALTRYYETLDGREQLDLRPFLRRALGLDAPPTPPPAPIPEPLPERTEEAR